MVFDVKHDLRHKCRLVAGGHLTSPNGDTSYSSVASLRSIRLVTFIAELNRLRLEAADVGNAYIDQNSSPIYYHSKKQASVENSSFGSEFIALKTCCEYIRGLRYKLRMMGIPVHLPIYIFEDNQSILKNSTLPDSVLQKKSSSIAYHFVRDGVVRREWLLT